MGIESNSLNQHPSGICLPKLLPDSFWPSDNAAPARAAEGVVFRLDALALSVIATATWLAGWLAGCLAGCLSQPVLYQND